ncbi:MAG: M23 family metallopeptidase [Microcoleaceae cyanobacterium]
MYSRLQRFWTALFLTFGLVVSASLWESEASPRTELSLEQPRIIAQQLAQSLIAQTLRTPQFSIPVQCSLGKDCFILLYPDRDPSPNEIDFGCGRQTYNSHTGTDFAIPDEQIMAQGVQVLASAPGKVLRVRDGVSDRRLENIAEKANVEGMECGNGVVIDHSSLSNGSGWETQYCHLRKGSIVVKPGDRVERGATLGMVGASGAASFPHVHLSVRHQGKIVDPFVGPEAGAGCQVNRTALWDQSLPYTPTGLIRSGFASAPPTMNQLWQGKFKETTLAKTSPNIIFWAQIYGVFQGDRVEYKLFDPAGNVVLNHQETLKSPGRTWFGYVGKKNLPQNPLALGNWRGEYRLIREGKVLLNIQRDVRLG